MERIADELAKQGVEGFEIFYQESYQQPVSFEQNVLQNLEFRTEAGVGVRVINDGRVGFTASSDLRDPKAIADSAIASARFGPEAAFSFPGPQGIPSFSFEGGEWPVEERLRLGKETVAVLSSLFPGLMVHSTASEMRIKTRIINSSGLDASYEKPFYLFTVYASGMTETGYLSDGEYRFFTRPPAPQEVIPQLKERIKKALTPGKISSGRKKVILAPGVMSLMLESLEMGLSGKNVVKGSSPLRDKLGEAVMGDQITLVEDPLHPWLAGSRPFDDEGLPSRPRTIVERGVLRSYNLDLWAAAKLGKEPTGSAARASYKQLPYPGFTNIVMKCGSMTLEEMIRSVDEGLIVYNPIGGGQSNMMAGDFSFNVGLGFVIARGELAGRVKDAMIAGNFYEDSHRIIALTADREPHGTFLLPYALFDGLSVSVKG
jgi:PmbA protein